MNKQQAEHAELFRRVAHHLAVAAGQLTSLHGPAKLSTFDVARLFLVTGTNIVVSEHGHAEAAEFLRQMADAIAADKPAVN